MTARKPRDPSPTRAALLHGSVGAVTLCGTLALGGTFVQLTGDERAGSPIVRMALFEADGTTMPSTRLVGNFGQTNAPTVANLQVSGLRQSQYETNLEPSLGVNYDSAPAPTPARVQRVAVGQAAPQATVQSVTINGKVVPYGKSLSQVEGGAAVAPVAIQLNALDVVSDTAAAPAPEKPSIEGPFTRYAQAFENAEQKPSISIIVGGLGINWGRTQAAISELPPEVTLSFSPTAQNLDSWVRKARRAGHEVLIEIPMEPYDYGRLRPHPQILQTGISSAANLQRLDKLLARTKGYMGVMNYQGGKFATDADGVAPIMAALNAKDIAFFEDGSLSKSEFSASAAQLDMAFGPATSWIDSRTEADEISTQLMLLEMTARESGKSLGTGMSFPITLDLIKAWIPTLEEKGLVLAPASYFARPNAVEASNVELAALDSQG